MNITKLASACFNSIESGLSGYNATLTISIPQLEDEVCETKLDVIYKHYLKNVLPKQDLYQSLNCINVDCESLDKCCDVYAPYQKPVAHFQIPQLVTSIGDECVFWVGSTDKQIKFKVYLGMQFRFHQYKLRRRNKPYVFIDTTVNKNGFFDCYIFNAPLLERLSMVGIFKDDRQFDQLTCCGADSSNDLTAIDMEVKDIITKKYIQYYRQIYQQPQPNNQIPK